MIDLHSHILPGLDDGAPNLDVSVAMARQWVADGVSVVACTPHILPGLYNNVGPHIREVIAALQAVLEGEDIPLHLVTGADAHIAGDFLEGLATGRILSLADSRYVLVEPPHNVAPQRMEEFFFSISRAGYVPVLTHPERLSWMKDQYDMLGRLVRGGAWMQITAGSLLGAFGRSAHYLAERMLDDGLVHILATDAHDVQRRPPNLAAGREAAARRVGEREAEHLVLTRPRLVLANAHPSECPEPCSDAGERAAHRPPHAEGRHVHAQPEAITLARVHAARTAAADRMRRLVEWR